MQLPSPLLIITCVFAGLLSVAGESCTGKTCMDKSADESALLQTGQVIRAHTVKGNQSAGGRWDDDEDPYTPETYCVVTFFHMSGCELADGGVNAAASPIMTTSSHEYKRIVKYEDGSMRWKIGDTMHEENAYYFEMTNKVRDDDYGKDNWVKSLYINENCQEVELYDEDKTKRGYEDNILIKPTVIDERGRVTGVDAWSEYRGKADVTTEPYLGRACVNLPNDLEEDVGGVYVTVKP